MPAKPEFPSGSNPVETWLHAEEPYVENAGFSQTVLGRLPKQRHPRLRRRIIKAGALLAGIGGVMVTLGEHPVAFDLWNRLQLNVTLLTLGSTGLALALAGAVTWVWVDRA